jgi:hypothetical protein
MDMNRTVTAELSKRAFGELAATITPAGLEQFKLERLLELRAVIDAMHAEQVLDRLTQVGRAEHRRPAR